MLTDKQLQALGEIYQKRMDELSAQYLTKMGEHIRDIGRMTPSDVHRLTELRRAGANVQSIQRGIAEAAGKTAREVEELFLKVAEENYKFAEQYYVKGRQIPLRENAELLKLIKAQARQTAAELVNLSRTTIQSELYRKAIDEAVQAVQSGVADYQSAIRRGIKRAAEQGLRVRYPNSGLTRRLDTAVRQNVLDGARQLQANVMEQTGKEFGADGVEISAHATCSEDHLFIQGKQYTMQEFDRLQATLERPIGQWNCRHVATPILLGISAPAFSEGMLSAFKVNSSERIDIEGLIKSRYEWTQEMRKVETAVRYQKDIAIAAKAAGDDTLRRNAQAVINKLDTVYAKIVKAARITSERERMAVSAFRRVKTR
jgi:hypothetical protein